MKHIGIALVMSVVGGSAMAGSMDAPVLEAPVMAAPALAPGFDWTGFYVGVSYGEGTASDGVSESDTDLVGLQFGYLRDLGTLVVGGELAYVEGNFDAFPAQDWSSTRLKLIGGLGAGRFMPYAFLGLSEYEVSDAATSVSDSATIYGLGARYAFGATGRVALGLEYLVETKDDFDGAGFDLESDDLSLRVDYRF